MEQKNDAATAPSRRIRTRIVRDYLASHRGRSAARRVAWSRGFWAGDTERLPGWRLGFLVLEIAGSERLATSLAGAVLGAADAAFKSRLSLPTAR